MKSPELNVSFPSKVVCSSAEYHAHHAVGSSSLRTILKRSPAHYKFERENPVEATPAMAFGTAVHQFLLEPNVFKSQMVVMPKFAGKGAVAAKDQWLIENHGKTIVSQDQRDAILSIGESISAHKYASTILSGGAAEESYFSQCAETGIHQKVRPDFLREGRVIVDVKTTLDASFKSFQRDIANYLYHVQAAYYLDVVSQVLGQNHDTFLILAVEKNAPYACAVYSIDEASIEVGRQEYMRALQILKKCQAGNHYPAYPDKITSMNLPSWAFPLEVA